MSEERLLDLKKSLGIDDVMKPTSKTPLLPSPTKTTESRQEKVALPSEVQPVKGMWVYSKLQNASWICRTPVFCGIATFVAVFIVFLIAKPGFLGSDMVDEKGDSVRKANTRLILWVSGAIGLLVLCGPYIVRWKFSQ